MRMKKNRIFKFSSVILSSLLISVPIISCSSYRTLGSDTVEVPSNGLDKPVTDNTTQNGNTSIVSPNISNAASIDISKFLEKTTTTFSQSVEDFVENYDFKSLPGNQNELSNDLLIYFYALSKKYTDLTITNPQIKNLNVNNVVQLNETQNNNNSKNSVILNSSKISFVVSVDIKTKVSKKIIIGSKEINLTSNKTHTLTITSHDELIEPDVSEYLSNFVLIWKLPKLNFQLDNEKWVENNFSFDQDFFSHTFQYKISNLENIFTYFDLQKKYEDKALNINEKDLKELVQKKIDSQMEQYLNYADYANQILNYLRQDIPINTLLRDISPILVNILIDNNIIQSYLKDFLINVIQSNDGKTPLIDIFDKYREEIYQFLTTFLGSLFVVIKPILDLVKPGLTSNSNEYKKLQQQMKSLPKDLQTIINQDILGVDGTPKDLLSILFDNYSKIFDLIGKNNQTLQNIKELLNIILQKSNNNYLSIYDSILKDGATTNKFLDVVKKFVTIPDSVSKILNTLITNNKNFNKTNLMAFVDSLYTFTNGMFETNQTYDSLENKYKNLSIQAKWYEEPKIDKTNKTINFKYEYDISLKKETILDISKLKELISKSAFIELIKEIAQSVGQSLPSQISITDIDKLILKFIPDKLILGKNLEGKDISTPNNFLFTFSSNNSKVWFKPIKDGDNFSSGLEFSYNMNIYHDDYEMINQITNAYKKNGNIGEYLLNLGFIASIKADVYYSDFWRSIVQDVLNRDYDISFNMNLNTGNVIATTKTYNENQYYSKYWIEDNTYKAGNGDVIVKEFDPSKQENYQVVKSNLFPNAKYQWIDDKDSEELIGHKPIFNEQLYTSLKARLFSFSDDLNYQLNMNPIFNINLPFHLYIHKATGIGSSALPNDMKLYIDIRLMISTVNLYLPFKVYDKHSKTLKDSVASTITYTKANVTTK